MEAFFIKPRLYVGEDPMAALDELAGKRVLIVTDGFLASSGLLDRVKARLTGQVEVFDKVEPDPSLRLVAQGVKALREFAPDVVLAFGGGSPMDCAKAMKYCSAQAAPSGGGGAGAARDGGGIPPAELPLWCIPTTAGTGSEVTSFAVLTDTERGVKYPLVEEGLLPDAAILDPALLDGVPSQVTAHTGMDVLTHAAEAYVAKGANHFTDALAEKAFALAYRSLPAAFAGDRGAKGDMLHASCLAGMAFNGAGLGVCHAMAHALGGRFHAPHGRINALLLPHVIHFNAVEERAGEKYGRLAKRCGLAANPRALAAALVRLRTGLKVAPKLNINSAEWKEALPGLVAAAMADVCLPGNPRAVSAADVEGMIKEVGG